MTFCNKTSYLFSQLVKHCQHSKMKCDLFAWCSVYLYQLFFFFSFFFCIVQRYNSGKWMNMPTSMCARTHTHTRRGTYAGTFPRPQVCMHGHTRANGTQTHTRTHSLTCYFSYSANVFAFTPQRGDACGPVPLFAPEFGASSAHLSAHIRISIALSLGRVPNSSVWLFH